MKPLWSRWLSDAVSQCNKKTGLDVCRTCVEQISTFLSQNILIDFQFLLVSCPTTNHTRLFAALTWTNASRVYHFPHTSYFQKQAKTKRGLSFNYISSTREVELRVRPAPLVKDTQEVLLSSEKKPQLVQTHMHEYKRVTSVDTRSAARMTFTTSRNSQSSNISHVPHILSHTHTHTHHLNTQIQFTDPPRSFFFF